MTDIQTQIILPTDDQDSSSRVPSLAPELVGWILELEVEGAGHESRQSLLHRASLVCKTWSSEAQPLLWTVIRISDETQARQLLSSPFLGIYRTENLPLSPLGEGDARLTMLSASTVVASLVGIKHLKLVGFWAEDVLETAFFALPGLKGLTSFELSSFDFRMRETGPPLLPVLSLQRLELRIANDHFPLSIWPVFFQSSLDHLTVNGPTCPTLHTCVMLLAQSPLTFDLCTLSVFHPLSGTVCSIAALVYLTTRRNRSTARTFVFFSRSYHHHPYNSQSRPQSFSDKVFTRRLA